MRSIICLLLLSSAGIGLFAQPALPPPTAGFATAQVDNDWYLFGGTIDTTHPKSNELPTHQMWVFKAVHNMWFNLLSPLKNAPEARTGHTMEAIGQKLYLLGGQGYSGYLADVHCYNVTTDSWTNLTSSITGIMPPPTTLTASAVVDGKIYRHGGLAKTGPYSLNESNELYIFDPDSLHMTMISDTSVPTMLSHCALSYQGKFYVFGRKLVGGTNTMMIFCFDPGAGTWSQVNYNTGSFATFPTPPPFTKAGASVITMPTGPNQAPQQWGVFYGGGLTGFSTMDTIWGYCFENQYWKKFDHLPLIHRSEGKGFVLDSAGSGGETTLTIFGGRESNTFALSDKFDRFVFDTSHCLAYQYDTVSKTWIDTSVVVPGPQPVLPSPRTGFASYHKDGVWYLMGGLVQDGRKGEEASEDLWIYQEASHVWERAFDVPPPPPRYGHQIVVLNNLLYALEGVGNDPNSHYSDIQQFDLTTQIWTDISSTVIGSKPMNTAFHSAGVVNGEVFIYGGQTKQTFNNIVIQNIVPNLYKFDPQQNISTYIPTLPNNNPPPKMKMQGLPYQNDQYYFGGLDALGQPTRDVWKHNTVTNQWTNLSHPNSLGSPPPEHYDGGITRIMMPTGMQKSMESWAILFGAALDSTHTLDTVWGFNLDQYYWKKFDHLPLITGTGVRGFASDTALHPGMVSLFFFGGRDLTTGALMDRFMKYEFDSSLCFVYTYDTTLLDWVDITPPPPIPFDGWMRVFLQGPYAGDKSMNTALNTNGYLPLDQPYTSSKLACDSKDSLLSIPADMVDWIMVELRIHPDTAIARTPALLMQNGQVLAVNGDTVLTFNAPPGNYYVAVNHRNHMPLMTAAKVSIPGVPCLDFSDPSELTLYGDGGILLEQGIRGMISGDLNHDRVLKYSGPSNDRSQILQRILGVVGGTAINATLNGYYPEDLRMDGTVKYSGAGNDASLIIQNLVNLTASNAINVTYTVAVPNPVYNPVKTAEVISQ